MINPLAVELNKNIDASNPYILDMLSMLGKKLFFPKGILSQSAEAKIKATRFNATIGIATEKGLPMHLACIAKYFPLLDPKDVFPYAPSMGKPELRKRWQEKIIDENPSLENRHISLPVVTNALTHGLSLIGDLFIDEGDAIILPSKYWGNYNLIYGIRHGAELKTFDFYTQQGGYNIDGLRKACIEHGEKTGKLVIIFNFPSNPTGYQPTVAEADEIAAILKDVANSGVNIVAISDDAYFGLFYDETCIKESVFSRIAGIHPRIMAIKIDGATKETYVWGFRVGFITYSITGSDDMSLCYDALEKKTGGAIRGNISNSSHPAQSIILQALSDNKFKEQYTEKSLILSERAKEVKDVLSVNDYSMAFEPYPFNSGYFMCIRLKKAGAESLRRHLLDEYQLGVISSGSHDIRIAFSCLEKSQIKEVFDTIYKAAREIENG